MKQFAIILFAFFAHGLALAQAEKIDAKKGNEAFGNKNYDEAVERYEKAISTNPDYLEARFNLGNAYQEMARTLMEQAAETKSEEEKKEILAKAKELSSKASSEYKAVAKKADSKDALNKTHYNLGNAELMSGKIDQSIEAYKEALRNNPKDDDARYNLAYAQHLKQKQQQQQQQQQQQNQDQKKQEEQKQDQQKQEEKKDQQEQNDQQQQDPQKPREMSKEEAEKLLQALMKQEKDLQEDLKKQKHKAKRIRIEKDW